MVSVVRNKQAQKNEWVACYGLTMQSTIWLKCQCKLLSKLFYFVHVMYFKVKYEEQILQGKPD